jgi:hypothetical protein
MMRTNKETTMIIGAHSIIYSTNPEADRAFLRDVLHLAGVDVGGGWLIFGLPPAELAVHPSDKNNVHEFYLMCDDVKALVSEMKKRRVACSQVTELAWGLLTQVSLPGGGKLGIYQPRHARPNVNGEGGAGKRPAKKGSKARLGSRNKIDFDTVRKIALELPDAEDSTAYGSRAVKVRGKLLTCIPTHKSAEPESLSVCIDFERRADLIATAPDIYYLTNHYENYPAVLVRLSRIEPDALKDLLGMAWRFVTAEAKRKKKSARLL